jgi:hypothetical protein
MDIPRDEEEFGNVPDWTNEWDWVEDPYEEWDEYWNKMRLYAAGVIQRAWRERRIKNLVI